MSDQDELFESDLIDRIANALPAELRADYYREIRHCQSLPQNDEMLRILRVMQFLVALIVNVPERMAAERQQLAEMIAGALAALQQLRQSTAAHQAQLDQRLAQLPKAIAEGIKPEAVAATINENLRRQFVKSTIPETADALAVAAAQIKKAAAEFAREANLLTNSYHAAAVDARKAIASLESTCSDAIRTTQNAAQELVRVFREEYRLSLYAFTALGLFVGIGIGIWYEHWLNMTAHP
jgi:hypothetical protein